MRTKSEQLEICRTCNSNNCRNCPDNHYAQAIKVHLAGIVNLSPVVKGPYFSKSPCECCKDELAGDRYDFTGRVKVGDKLKEKVEISCCIDCFGYLFT